MKLYAYQIFDDKIDESHSNFTKRLIEHWEVSKESIASRRYKRRESDKEEFILSYSIIDKQNQIFFGTIVKIAHSKDLPEIPEEFFNRESFRPSDIEQDGSESTRILGTYFFISDGCHLVTNQHRIGIIAFYCNKFLETYGRAYEFNHLIAPPPEISLGGIKSITFGGDAVINNKADENKENTIRSVGNECLKLFLQGDSLKTIIESEIVSADLVLSFSKKKMKKSPESVKKVISAVLGNINEVNDVTIKTLSGHRINVGEMEMFKEIEVDIQGVSVNEEELYEKMKQYLHEIKGESV